MDGLAPLVVRLQTEAADSSKAVSDLLRLAKIAATKLGATEALVWIDRELDGYPSVPAKDLPAYRQLHGTPKAWNPYHGWQPIVFETAKTQESCSYCPIGQSVTSLESTLRSGDGTGVFFFDYPPEIATKVQKAMSWRTPVHVEIGRGQVSNIVDQVRNLILNWSLALEKGGIVGESMNFTAKEKIEAAPITQHYFIQNVGVLGNVNDAASVQNTQTASASLDLTKVSEFLASLHQSAAGLPPEVREVVIAEAEKAEAALKSDPPDQGFLRASLSSIGSVCEGAAANLTAMGIVAAIRMYFGI